MATTTSQPTQPRPRTACDPRAVGRLVLLLDAGDWSALEQLFTDTV